MTPEHRKLITKNIQILMDETNVTALLPQLYKKGIFTENMREKYPSNEGRMGRDLRRKMFFEIQTRGPNAFSNFVSALSDSGHESLANLLDPDWHRKSKRGKHATPWNLPDYIEETNPDIKKNIADFIAKHPRGTIDMGTQPLEIHVKKLTQPADTTTNYKTNIYEVSSRPKGYAMIINIQKYNNDIKKERHGAEHDQAHLKTLFEQLGYRVETQENLAGEEMMNKIKTFAKSERHSHVDSCIMAILSHGEQDRGETYFVAADGKAIPVTSILELFSNDQCEHLRNKPKIFFFQSCRGDRKVHGIKGDFFRTKTDGTSEIPLRIYSDMLIAYSTVTGYESHRDIYLGTWYIQAICEVFMKHACDTEITEMLKLVDKQLESWISEDNTMQTTCFENRGFKTFFFNPGVYDDEKGD